MKVWVVLDDYTRDYEGYSFPHGVFSTKKKAQKFVKLAKEAGWWKHDKRDPEIVWFKLDGMLELSATEMEERAL